MSTRSDTVWQSPELADKFVNSVRGAVPLAAEQIEVMLRLIAAAGRPVRRFMDLGCGDGVLADAILTRHPQARGVLLDFSETMLKAGQGRFAGTSVDVRFQLADYADEKWCEIVASDGAFDVIVSGYSIHHQPDERKRALYRELFQLLEPGGIFINVEHVSSATTWGESVFETHFIDALHDFGHRQGWNKTREQISAEYYHRPDKDANILAPVERQCEWLREIGFQDVDCYFKIFELAVFAGRRPE